MVQILPADDPFDSPAVGTSTSICLYTGHRPNTSDFQDGYLHSGYQGILPLSPGVNRFTNGAACPTVLSEDLDKPRGFATHRTYGPDVTVRGVFKVAALAGAPESYQVINMGVFSRISGGGLSDSGNHKISRNATDCYSAQILPNSGGDGARFAIIRYSSGTDSTLAEVDFPIAVPSILAPMTITLEVTGTGGSVSIDATADGWGFAGDATNLTYIDTSGSRVVVAGEAGFSTGVSRLYAVDNNTLIELIYTFEIEESSNVVWRDEFERVNLLQGMDVNWDGNSYLDEATSEFSALPGAPSFEGQSLQQAYAWDLFTYEPDGSPGIAHTANSGAGDAFQRRISSPITATIDHSNGSENVQCVAISTRPASDERSQHRAVSVTMVSSGESSGSYGGGIALRSSYVRPQTNPGASNLGTFQGYAFVCAVSVTQTVFSIQRWKPNGSLTFVATYTDSTVGGTHFPGLGVSFVMDFEIYNEGDPLDGDAVMIAKVDGTQVELVASSSGATSDASGTVRDGSSSRIRSGPGEGMYYHNNSNLAKVARFDSWAQGAVQNAVVKPEEMGTYTLLAEAISPTGNLHDILSPDFPFETSKLAAALRHPMESGHTQNIVRWRAKVGSALISRRTWTFTKAVATETEYQALKSFFESHRSGEIPFFWRPPGSSTTYTASFATDETLDGLLAFVGTRSLSFKIEELR